jgi:diguanylate cyclase (GGDEF)-like protein
MRRARFSRGNGGFAWIGALVLALALLSVAIGTAMANHSREQDALERALSGEALEQSEALDHYFARARSLTQVTANNPAFRSFYEEPGDRRQKILAQGETVRDVNRALAYLEHLFPGSVGEACFIDRAGPENARAVSGDVAPIAELSSDERAAPFFKPTFALKPGQVYQARPYVSPDTHSWVVSNSTPLATAGGAPSAIVHFEISLDSFRRQLTNTSPRFHVAVVEARSGRAIVDSRNAQPSGDEARLGRPFDERFERMVSTVGQASESGNIDVSGKPSAFRAVRGSLHNANEWVVVAIAKSPEGSWIDDLGVAESVMGALGLLLLGYAILRLRSSQSRLHSEAISDALTGLGNRRKLLSDLECAIADADETRPVLLAMFDLDGFKIYNDTFGHPAGDALLTRLGGSLRDSLGSLGTPYRLGGDEFCVLAQLYGDQTEEVVSAAERGLTEHGEGFTITCSYGSVVIPRETSDAEEAMRIADRRMYAHKSASRASAGRQSTDVAVRMLAERYPELADHLDGVTELSAMVGRSLGLPQDELTTLLQAASLHDVGKVAVPDTILTKPGPLEPEEWEFIRQHPIIGERILGAAPALSGAARLVRANHERIDGNGYPDGLIGDQIPLGARIICVCDAYHAMTTPRPYRPVPLSDDDALAELRAGAGTQFDPHVVDVFCTALAEHRTAEAHVATSA